MSNEKLQLGGRGFALGVIVLVVVAVAGTAAVLLNSSAPPTSTAPPTAQPTIAVDPTTVFQLTAIPDMQLVTGELRDDLATINALYDNCDEYNDARREQMRLHFFWLENPDELPFDVALAVANNPAGRLLFGMATFTSAQWSQNGADPDSCLVEIGLRLNDLLPIYGEEVLEDFQPD